MTYTLIIHTDPNNYASDYPYLDTPYCTSLYREQTSFTNLLAAIVPNNAVDGHCAPSIY